MRRLLGKWRRSFPMQYIRKVIPGARRVAVSSTSRPSVAEAQHRLAAMSAELTGNDLIRIGDVRFRRSYPAFETVLAEIFYHEVYNFSFLHGNWVVIDVGANAGAASLWMASRLNVRRVYAFEPVGPTYALLIENIELNPSLKDKIEAYRNGLGGTTQTLRVPFHRDHITSVSSRGTFDACFKPESLETIDIVCASSALEPIFLSCGQDRVFLKLDCEGAEYEILPCLATAGLLRRVEALIVEWHGGDHQSLVTALEGEGFFCFTEWERRDRWQIGLIRAVRQNGERERVRSEQLRNVGECS